MTVTDFDNQHDNSYLGENENENKAKHLTPICDNVATMDMGDDSAKHVTVAFDALLTAKRHFDKHEHKSNMIVLIIGANETGKLAAKHAPMMLARQAGQVNVFLADSSTERLIAVEEVCNDVICWPADEHEQSMVEKTISTCKGGADLILDFIGNSRTIQRAMKILNKGGAILIGPDSLQTVSINLYTLFAQQQSILGIPHKIPNDAATLENRLHGLDTCYPYKV